MAEHQFAPIALFVFNRPHHTKETVEALMLNDQAKFSDLIIFSDGARMEKGNSLVADVRRYIKTIHGFKSVSIIESPVNKGLAASIIFGVSYVLERYNTIIVLEDDMISSPFFLRYMNEALLKYAHHEEVISVHGYWYPVGEAMPDTFFLKGAECWGWATWARGWKLFNPDAWHLLYQILINGKKREFDFENSYPYTRMLFNQCIGRVNSWAIRWYASAFLADKLTLYPNRSLIRNIGLDDSGTHSQSVSKEMFQTVTGHEVIELKEIKIEESNVARMALARHFRRTATPALKKIQFLFRKYFTRRMNT